MRDAFDTALTDGTEPLRSWARTTVTGTPTTRTTTRRSSRTSRCTTRTRSSPRRPRCGGKSGTRNACSPAPSSSRSQRRAIPSDTTVTAAGAADPWLQGTGLAGGRDDRRRRRPRARRVINPWPDCVHPGLTVLFHYDGYGVDQPGDAVRYTAPSGARVFASGAMQFSWALDDWRSNGTIGPAVARPVQMRVTPADPRVQQFMRNALDDALTRPPAPQAMMLSEDGDDTHRDRQRRPPIRAPAGFVAFVCATGRAWVPLCRGVVACSGRLPAAGVVVVGAVSLDAWDRRSGADYATATITRSSGTAAPPRTRAPRSTCTATTSSAVSEAMGIPVDQDGLAGRDGYLEDPDGNRLRVATRRP